MGEKIIDLGHGFWTVRGNFRLFGLLNIGTQCSLVRRPSGKFVFLDSYSLAGPVREKVMALTDNGRNVEAVLNVHPFHTIHCAQMAADFPDAQFFGSKRHHEKIPQVNWNPNFVESTHVAEQFEDLEFSLPDGLTYIHENEKIHAGSLLVFHPASGTLHVDDTFNVFPLPKALSRLTGMKKISLHPTLSKAFKDEDGSEAAFCDWLDSIAHKWSNTRTLCAAHSSIAQFEPEEFKKVLLDILNEKKKNIK